MNESIGTIVTFISSLSVLIGGIIAAIVTFKKAPKETDQIAANSEKIRAEVTQKYQEIAALAADEIKELKKELADQRKYFADEIKQLQDDLQTHRTNSRKREVELQAQISKQNERIEAQELENCLLNEWAHDLVDQVIELRGTPKTKPSTPKNKKGQKDV